MARFLMHSINPRDFGLNSEVLTEIIRPRMEPIVIYRESHPCSYSFIARVLEGVQGESANMFLSKLAGFLNRFMDIKALRSGLRLLHALFAAAYVQCKNSPSSESNSKSIQKGKEKEGLKGKGKDGEFILALLHSNEIWKSLFFLLGRTAMHLSLQEEELGDTIMSLVFKVVGNVVMSCNTLWKEESERLLITLTSAGMFDALDQTLPLCITLNQVPGVFHSSSLLTLFETQ